MPKELIVSVNGREKKIAIIENERVTEFYIERGEENQGIVGNIYKGRVMRVLPGMQSAFVDIGLERDAFLYVSDFFDEEEEFERIVIDKTRKGEAVGAARAAAEHIEQARLEREHRIEATQERVTPLLDAEQSQVGATAIEVPAFEQGEAPDADQLTDQARDEEQQETDAAGKRRGRRGRKRGRGAAQERPGEATEYGTAVTTSSALDTRTLETPFVAGASSFERVVDEDELAIENGAMLKDAILQERILDQIHAVEFNMEDVRDAQVGSILSTGASPGVSFHRVDDSDISAGSEDRDSAPVRQAVAAHVDAFIDEIAEETAGARSFERVSDEEGGAEAPTTTGADETEGVATTATRGRRGRSRRAGAKEEATEPGAGEAPKAKRGGRKQSAAKGAKSAASTKTRATKGRKRRSTQTGPAESGEGTDLALSETADADGAGTEHDGVAAYGDAEASITPPRSRGEFATRRGGRRRRRSGKQQEGGGEEDRANGKDHDAATDAEVRGGGASTAPSRSEGRRDHPPRGGREGQSGGGRDGRGGRGGGGPRRERQQPAITDLLREGQEILVQIAKEPIAKKGARITSHIALPGRFLVYMPTVEHVGVSRKIESDSERARLRKLIQAIRAEEDVPSGGFIVRTAGIGISEADLRDDARYLVRTWLDIRRDAEKAKAPALVHRDLDLVQRILRDQLSDDFTAIRVDSEEEYLRIVEFINRIQPRMVKRVKLYTRDEPILEAFGVQAEVDKAIKPRVWLKSGGYLVINQTEALVAIDVNTGKFVGRGGSRLEDTITKTNLEAVEEIVRQIRLRDLGGIIVLDLIDMEDRRNRNRVMQALQEALQGDKSPTKVLSFNDFGLVIMTRKRVKQSLERTLCAPCPYCQGAGLVKSPQTVCYEILEEARRLAKNDDGEGVKQTTLRINPEVVRALRGPERDVLAEIEDYLGVVDITSDPYIHQEQFDFAFI